jgi:hypothetical protein
MVLRPRLVRNHAGHALHEGSIPGGRETDHLRENGGPAIAADAVAGFVPPVVGRHAEPFDRIVLVHELVDFLRQREPCDQIVDPRGERQ